MTKEQFIHGVSNGFIDPVLSYNYFLSKGGKGSYQEFFSVFNSNINAVFERFLKEFNLTSLHDKNGNFIRIIL